MAFLVLIVVGVLMMGAGAGVMVAAVRSDDAHQYPSRWDPRVEAVARWVERDRGLTFRHPVAVEFLSESRYSKAARGEDDKPTAKDRKAAADTAAAYRALGLLQGNVDLLAASRELFDSGTLAFYDFEKKVVNVRGTKMSVELRVTLAHELTHALQDQHFDLARITVSDSDEVMAVRSLMEGDAVTTEQRYVAELPDAERREYETSSAASSEKAKTDLSDVPDVLSAGFSAQYAIGPPFVSLVEARSRSDSPDTGAIDDVIEDPPDSTAFLFHPPDHVAGASRGKVKAPPRGPKKYVVDDGIIGAYDLFIQLSERIDPVQAMHAVDGWRADSYVTRREEVGGERRVCVRANLATASARDGDELRSALEKWAATLPAASSATVSGQGRQAAFRTCDPGPDAAVGVTGRSSDALAYPAARLQYMAEAVRAGVPEQDAFCEADVVISGLPLDDLTASELSDSLQRRILELRSKAERTCG